MKDYFMNISQITTLNNFENIRPEHVQDVIYRANAKGINIDDIPNLNSAINHLLQEFEKRKDRYAPKTIKRLYSAWGKFVEWCANKSLQSLPAAASTVETFFIDKSTTLHRNTLSIYRWAISRVHKITGCPDPCTDVFVEDRLKMISRTKVRNGEKIKQAAPFNEKHLDLLIRLWGKSSKLIDKRNLLLLAIAYESMLRESELANIKLSHIEITDFDDAILTIPVTKINHSGEPDTCILSSEIVTMYRNYISEAKLNINTDPFLFCGISKHNTPLLRKEPKPISTKTIEGVFKKAWEDLSLITSVKNKFTGHSARVGATQDLLSKGYSTLQVQQSGRWATSTMVSRYGRAILARDSAMSKSRIRK